MSLSFGLLPHPAWVSETQTADTVPSLQVAAASLYEAPMGQQAFSFSWEVGFTEPLCWGGSRG